VSDLDKGSSQSFLINKVTKMDFEIVQNEKRFAICLFQER